MSYSVTIQGIDVACQDPRDVLRLIEAASSRSADAVSQRGRGRPRAQDAKQQEKLKAQRRLVKSFLIAIQAAGDSGSSAKSLAQNLDLRGPKGVGGAAVVVNRFLADAGFDAKDVYRRAKRVVGESRRWIPGSRIAEAIAALTKKAHPSNNGTEAAEQ